MVVATEVELLESTSLKYGKFNPEGSKKTVREQVIVPRSYVERVNGENGKKFYIVDEEATEQMTKDRNANLKRKAEEAKTQNVSTNDLLRALISEQKSEPGASKEKTELDLLRERCDELGIPYKKTQGVKTLNSLIEKAEKDEN